MSFLLVWQTVTNAPNEYKVAANSAAASEP
jgi:hypothetical protein